MSNKTTFKRIALAVVAALGFGVLASGPSQAVITGLTVTSTAASGTTTAKSDTTTAATLSFSFTHTNNTDTVSVQAFLKSAPATAGAPVFRIFALDTATSSTASVFRVSQETASTIGSLSLNTSVPLDSRTVLVPGANQAGFAAGKIAFAFDTTTGLVAGTYVIGTIVTPFTAAGAGTPVTQDVTTVVAKTTATLLAESTVIDPTQTVAVLSDTSGVVATTLTADSSIAASATASATPRAYIRVLTKNAAGNPTPESVTATITGAGVLSVGAISGSTIKIAGDGDDVFTILSDGRAGIGSIVISTTSKTFPAKTVTFYAAAPSTVTPAVLIPVIGLAEKTALEATALDANGNVWGGQAYLFSQDTKVATAGTCKFVPADGVHTCTVTGVAAGQSSFKIGNATTEAASTVLTAAFNGPRVTIKTASTVKIEFDKAAYAPGEKARIYVTPLDDAGLGVVGGSLSSLLATGGIASSVAFSSGSDTLTATTLEVAEESSATTGAKAGSAMYTVYMPFGKGTVTLTAKGGTGLPVAGRVAITASAEVVDDSVDAAVDAAQEATDAAVAATDAAILAQEAADEAASAAIAAQETAQAAVDAVTALSAEVTKLVAQLATLQKLLNRVAKRVGVKR